MCRPAHAHAPPAMSTFTDAMPSLSCPSSGAPAQPCPSNDIAHLAALSALCCSFVCWLAQGDVGSGTDVCLCGIAVVESFLRDDSVNFCRQRH